MKTKRIVLALVGVPMVAAVAALAPAAGAANGKATRWVCSITGRTVEKCCCVSQKDGTLYCTLAKKTVDQCCCEPASSK